MNDLLNKKLEYIKKIKATSQEMLNLDPEAETDQIIKLSEEKEKCIKKIDELDSELRNYSIKFKDKDNEELIKVEIQNIVQEIINIDAAVRMKLKREMNELKGKMKSNSNNNKILLYQQQANMFAPLEFHQNK